MHSVDRFAPVVAGRVIDRTQLECQVEFIIHPLINSRLKGAGVGSYEDMRRVIRFKINATLNLP